MKKSLGLILIFVLILSMTSPIPIEAASGEHYVSIAAYGVTINGELIDSEYTQYPFIVYNGVTYFPLTWDYGNKLGLEIAFEGQNGLSISKTTPKNIGINYYPAKNRMDIYHTAYMAWFDVSINGRKVDYTKHQYPILVFRNLTYFPMTWDYAVNEFGWDFSYDYNKGLFITTSSNQGNVASEEIKPNNNNNNDYDQTQSVDQVSNDPIKIDNTDYYEKFIEFPTGQYNINEAKGIETRVRSIPSEYIETLVYYDVKLILVTGSITDIEEYAYLKGVTPRGWENTGKTWDDIPGIGGNPVGVKIGESFNNLTHGSVNLELHEVAHAIDYYVFETISADKEFQKIWKAETESMYPGVVYQASYPEEYFAESFAYYYLSYETRSNLMDNAPRTHQFFEQLERGYSFDLND